jgi:hypothetical protein
LKREDGELENNGRRKGKESEMRKRKNEEWVEEATIWMGIFYVFQSATVFPLFVT